MTAEVDEETLQYCFVPDDELVYRIVQIVGSEFDKNNIENYNIRCITNEKPLLVTTVKASDCQLIRGRLEDLLPTDFVHLYEVTNASILHALRERFYTDQIYTCIGSILTSINPFKFIKNIYSEQLMCEYRDKRMNLSKNPHLFALAQRAHEGLQQGYDQSLIISGESGAGKTEATKVCLNYLAYCAGSTSGIQLKVLRSSPILEAFGNAKTLRNNNSSRFGKFIELNFDKSYQITGAVSTTYLLEKSRVVCQQQGERNYHIFYQLLAGASKEMIKQLHLEEMAEKPSTVKYINCGNCNKIDDIDDVTEFFAVQSSFTEVGFSSENVSVLYRLLAGILHLGNIEFKKKPDNQGVEEVFIADDSLHWLDKAVSMFGVDFQTLTRALICKTVQSGGNSDRRGSVTVKPFDLVSAYENKNALSKEIYSRCFDWIVIHVNKSMMSDSISDAFYDDNSGNMIGVLDIFGFEVFANNSFEQLCINLANEALQQHFNQSIFKAEMELYGREDVKVPVLDFVDNQDVLDLLTKRRDGIFSMVDEECIVPRGSWEGFLHKLEAKHGNHTRFVKPKKGGDFFVVKHYAGEVQYDPSLFLSKNKDTLSLDLISIFSMSTVSVLAQLFDINENQFADFAGSPAGKRSSQVSHKQTVGQRFTTQLVSLIDTLNKTSPQYIRCIKPNNVKKPKILDSVLTYQQLSYSGVFEAVIIMKKGYPFRYSLLEFRNRFHFLVNEDAVRRKIFGTNQSQQQTRSRSLSSVGNSDSSNNVTRDMCISLVSYLALSKGYSELLECYVGMSMVFYRTNQNSILESLRHKVFSKTISVLQRCSRRTMVQRLYLRIINGVRRLNEFDSLDLVDIKDVCSSIMTYNDRLYDISKCRMDVALMVGLIQYADVLMLENALVEELEPILADKKNIFDKYERLEEILHTCQSQCNIDIAVDGIKLVVSWENNMVFNELLRVIQCQEHNIKIQKQLVSAIEESNEVTMKILLQTIEQLQSDDLLSSNFCHGLVSDTKQLISSSEIQLGAMEDAVTDALVSGRFHRDRSYNDSLQSYDIIYTVDYVTLSDMLTDDYLVRMSRGIGDAPSLTSLFYHACTRLVQLREYAANKDWEAICILFNSEWKHVILNEANTYEDRTIFLSTHMYYTFRSEIIDLLSHVVEEVKLPSLLKTVASCRVPDIDSGSSIDSCALNSLQLMLHDIDDYYPFLDRHLHGTIVKIKECYSICYAIGKEDEVLLKENIANSHAMRSTADGIHEINAASKYINYFQCKRSLIEYIAIDTPVGEAGINLVYPSIHFKAFKTAYEEDAQVVECKYIGWNNLKDLVFMLVTLRSYIINRAYADVASLLTDNKQRLLDIVATECMLDLPTQRLVVDELEKTSVDTLHQLAMVTFREKLALGSVTGDVGNIDYSKIDSSPLIDALQNHTSNIVKGSEAILMIHDCQHIIKMRDALRNNSNDALSEMIDVVKSQSNNLTACSAICRKELTLICDEAFDLQLRAKLINVLTNNSIDVDSESGRIVPESIEIVQLKDILMSVEKIGNTSSGTNYLLSTVKIVYSLRKAVLHNLWESAELVIGKHSMESILDIFSEFNNSYIEFLDTVNDSDATERVYKHAMGDISIILSLSSNFNKNLLDIRSLECDDVYVSDLLNYAVRYGVHDAAAGEVDLIRRVAFERRCRIVLLLACSSGHIVGNVNRLDVTGVEYDGIIAALTYSHMYVKYLSPRTILWIRVAEDLLRLRTTVKSLFHERPKVGNYVDISPFVKLSSILEVIKYVPEDFHQIEFQLVADYVHDNIAANDLVAAMHLGRPVNFNNQFDWKMVDYVGLNCALDRALDRAVLLDLVSWKLERLIRYAALYISLRKCIKLHNWETDDGKISTHSGRMLSDEVQQILTKYKTLNMTYANSSSKNDIPQCLHDDFNIVKCEWDVFSIIMGISSLISNTGHVHGRPFYLILSDIKMDSLSDKITMAKLFIMNSGNSDHGTLQVVVKGVNEMLDIRRILSGIQERYERSASIINDAASMSGDSTDVLTSILEQSRNCVTVSIESAMSNVNAISSSPSTIVEDEWKDVEAALQQVKFLHNIPGLRAEFNLLTAETFTRRFVTSSLAIFSAIHIQCKDDDNSIIDELTGITDWFEARKVDCPSKAAFQSCDVAQIMYSSAVILIHVIRSKLSGKYDALDRNWKDVGITLTLDTLIRAKADNNAVFSMQEIMRCSRCYHIHPIVRQKIDVFAIEIEDEISYLELTHAVSTGVTTGIVGELVIDRKVGTSDLEYACTRIHEVDIGTEKVLTLFDACFLLHSLREAADIPIAGYDIVRNCFAESMKVASEEASDYDVFQWFYNGSFHLHHLISDESVLIVSNIIDSYWQVLAYEAINVGGCIDSNAINDYRRLSLSSINWTKLDEVLALTSVHSEKSRTTVKLVEFCYLLRRVRCEMKPVLTDYQMQFNSLEDDIDHTLYSTPLKLPVLETIVSICSSALTIISDSAEVLAIKAFAEYMVVGISLETLLHTQMLWFDDRSGLSAVVCLVNSLEKLNKSVNHTFPVDVVTPLDKWWYSLRTIASNIVAISDGMRQVNCTNVYPGSSNYLIVHSLLCTLIALTREGTGTCKYVVKIPALDSTCRDCRLAISEHEAIVSLRLIPDMLLLQSGIVDMSVGSDGLPVLVHCDSSVDPVALESDADSKQMLTHFGEMTKKVVLLHCQLSIAVVKYQYLKAQSLAIVINDVDVLNDRNGNAAVVLQYCDCLLKIRSLEMSFLYWHLPSVVGWSQLESSAAVTYGINDSFLMDAIQAVKGCNQLLCFPRIKDTYDVACVLMELLTAIKRGCWLQVSTSAEAPNDALVIGLIRETYPGVLDHIQTDAVGSPPHRPSTVGVGGTVKDAVIRLFALVGDTSASSICPNIRSYLDLLLRSVQKELQVLELSNATSQTISAVTFGGYAGSIYVNNQAESLLDALINRLTENAALVDQSYDVRSMLQTAILVKSIVGAMNSDNFEDLEELVDFCRYFATRVQLLDDALLLVGEEWVHTYIPPDTLLSQSALEHDSIIAAAIDQVHSVEVRYNESYSSRVKMALSCDNTSRYSDKVVRYFNCSIDDLTKLHVHWHSSLILVESHLLLVDNMNLLRSSIDKSCSCTGGILNTENLQYDNLAHIKSTIDMYGLNTTTSDGVAPTAGTILCELSTAVYDIRLGQSISDESLIDRGLQSCQLLRAMESKYHAYTTSLFSRYSLTCTVYPSAPYTFLPLFDAEIAIAQTDMTQRRVASLLHIALQSSGIELRDSIDQYTSPYSEHELTQSLKFALQKCDEVADAITSALVLQMKLTASHLLQIRRLVVTKRWLKAIQYLDALDVSVLVVDNLKEIYACQKLSRVQYAIEKALKCYSTGMVRRLKSSTKKDNMDVVYNDIDVAVVTTSIALLNDCRSDWTTSALHTHQSTCSVLYHVRQQVSCKNWLVVYDYLKLALNEHRLIVKPVHTLAMAEVTFAFEMACYAISMESLTNALSYGSLEGKEGYTETLTINTLPVTTALAVAESTTCCTHADVSRLCNHAHVVIDLREAQMRGEWFSRHGADYGVVYFNDTVENSITSIVMKSFFHDSVTDVNGNNNSSSYHAHYVRQIVDKAIDIDHACSPLGSKPVQSVEEVLATVSGDLATDGSVKAEVAFARSELLYRRIIYALLHAIVSRGVEGTPGSIRSGGCRVDLLKQSIGAAKEHPHLCNRSHCKWILRDAALLLQLRSMYLANDWVNLNTFFNDCHHENVTNQPIILPVWREISLLKADLSFQLCYGKFGTLFKDTSSLDRQTFSDSSIDTLIELQVNTQNCSELYPCDNFDRLIEAINLAVELKIFFKSQYNSTPKDIISKAVHTKFRDEADQKDCYINLFIDELIRFQSNVEYVHLFDALSKCVFDGQCYLNCPIGKINTDEIVTTELELLLDNIIALKSSKHWVANSYDYNYVDLAAFILSVRNKVKETGTNQRDACDSSNGNSSNGVGSIDAGGGNGDKCDTNGGSAGDDKYNDDANTKWMDIDTMIKSSRLSLDGSIVESEVKRLLLEINSMNTISVLDRLLRDGKLTNMMSVAKSFSSIERGRRGSVIDSSVDGSSVSGTVSSKYRKMSQLPGNFVAQLVQLEAALEQAKKLQIKSIAASNYITTASLIYQIRLEALNSNWISVERLLYEGEKLTNIMPATSVEEIASMKTAMRYHLVIASIVDNLSINYPTRTCGRFDITAISFSALKEALHSVHSKLFPADSAIHLVYDIGAYVCRLREAAINATWFKQASCTATTTTTTTAAATDSSNAAVSVESEEHSSIEELLHDRFRVSIEGKIDAFKSTDDRVGAVELMGRDLTAKLQHVRREIAVYQEELIERLYSKDFIDALEDMPIMVQIYLSKREKTMDIMSTSSDDVYRIVPLKAALESFNHRYSITSSSDSGCDGCHIGEDTIGTETFSEDFLRLYNTVKFVLDIRNALDNSNMQLFKHLVSVKASSTMLSDTYGQVEIDAYSSTLVTAKITEFELLKTLTLGQLRGHVDQCDVTLIDNLRLTSLIASCKLQVQATDVFSNLQHLIKEAEFILSVRVALKRHDWKSFYHIVDSATATAVDVQLCVHSVDEIEYIVQMRKARRLTDRLEVLLNDDMLTKNYELLHHNRSMTIMLLDSLLTEFSDVMTYNSHLLPASTGIDNVATYKRLFSNPEYMSHLHESASVLHKLLKGIDKGLWDVDATAMGYYSSNDLKAVNMLTHFLDFIRQHEVTCRLQDVHRQISAAFSITNSNANANGNDDGNGDNVINGSRRLSVRQILNKIDSREVRDRAMLANSSAIAIPDKMKRRISVAVNQFAHSVDNNKASTAANGRRKSIATVAANTGSSTSSINRNSIPFVLSALGTWTSRYANVATFIRNVQMDLIDRVVRRRIKFAATDGRLKYDSSGLGIEFPIDFRSNLLQDALYDASRCVRICNKFHADLRWGDETKKWIFIGEVLCRCRGSLFAGDLETLVADLRGWDLLPMYNKHLHIRSSVDDADIVEEMELLKNTTFEYLGEQVIYKAITLILSKKGDIDSGVFNDDRMVSLRDLSILVPQSMVHCTMYYSRIIRVADLLYQCVCSAVVDKYSGMSRKLLRNINIVNDLIAGSALEDMQSSVQSVFASLEDNCERSSALRMPHSRQEELSVSVDCNVIDPDDTISTIHEVFREIAGCDNVSRTSLSTIGKLRDVVASFNDLFTCTHVLWSLCATIVLQQLLDSAMETSTLLHDRSIIRQVIIPLPVLHFLSQWKVGSNSRSSSSHLFLIEDGDDDFVMLRHRDQKSSRLSGPQLSNVSSLLKGIILYQAVEAVPVNDRALVCDYDESSGFDDVDYDIIDGINRDVTISSSNESSSLAYIATLLKKTRATAEKLHQHQRSCSMPSAAGGYALDGYSAMRAASMCKLLLKAIGA